MKRLQKQLVINDLKEKYVFLAGPRQCGKTTLSKQLFPSDSTQYLNYNSDDRPLMVKALWSREKQLVILDEFHKFPKWKTFLKGIYDTEGLKPPILVTGSAKLNVFKKGNDSMVGRYYYHRLLPLSVKELSSTPKQEALENLLQYGNFPEPFLKGSALASKRWRHLYFEKIIREDITDLSNIRSLPKITLLIDLLRERVGSTVSYTSLARDLEIAPKTVKEWIDLLEELYVVFRVGPHHKNIARSLLKEPKIYFFDCSMAVNPEHHLENLVAVSLLKHLWFLEDTQGIKGRLCYLRTKDGKEIDFALVQDGKVTEMIEVKTSDTAPVKAFGFFRQHLPQTKCHQIVKNIRQEMTINDIQVVSVANYLGNLAI